MAARARVRGEDEVGVLARTFNEMASEIEEQMSLLHNFQKFFDLSIEMMCIAKTDGYFERVKSVGPDVNTSSREGQPTISDDGLTLVFDSDDYAEMKEARASDREPKYRRR